MGCEACGLCKYSDPTCIWGSGNTKSSIMIINSYAGDQDEDEGVATMSRELVNRLQSIGIDPDSIYYTNLIKCRAPKGTKYKVGEIKKCKSHTLEEISNIKPKYILLIGAQATKALLDRPITECNGVPQELDGIIYLPTFNPGVIYRDPGKTPFVEQAFNNFKALVKGKGIKKHKINKREVYSIKDIDRAFRYFTKKGYYEIAYDIETTGLSRFEEEINLFGFGNSKVQYILPLQAPFSPLRNKLLLQAKLIRHLVKKLNEHATELIAANGKFDDLFLWYKQGVRPHITFDTMLASHCLDENTSNGLKENAILEFNATPWDINKDLKKGNCKTPQDYEDYKEYLAYDIMYTSLLKDVYEERLKEDSSLDKLFRHLYMPGIQAYEDVEHHGVNINMSQFKKVRRHLESKLAEVEKKLNKYGKINWNSPKAINNLLYEELGLPIIERTDSGAPSTSEATLKQLYDKSPVIPLILEYRGIHIQISHFIDGWINRMHEGRIFPKFKLNGTVTGRTACQDPNLQQVPRDPIIRNLIGAPPGWSIVEGDFSQAELRIAAILSGDNTMKRIYQTGGDIHTHTYEMISGEKVSDDKYIKKEQRKKAKAVNFGFVYGMGYKKFKDYARDSYGVNLTEKEAQRYRERFFETYSLLPEWHARQRKIVRTLGQVRNPIGRLRRLPDIYSSDKSKVAEAERQSINSPVQGFGSDLTILGMAELARTSKCYDKERRKFLEKNKHKYHIIGTVHDATLFEVRNDFLMEFLPVIKETLEGAKALSEIFHFESPLPMVVDLQVGLNWGSGKELDFEGDKWKSQVQEYLDSLEE